VSGEIQGKARGSATHLALQYLRFENCGSLVEIEKEIQRLVREGFLSEQQGAVVECQQLERFFQTEIGKRLRASENVLREFKFSVLDDGAAFDPELIGEKILLQGVVDCALMDDDGIVVMDFKTDRVSEDTIYATAQRYRPQVEAYAEALSRIFEKNVKAKMLYFFHLNQFVEF
jgi:ATP-dependent helicase/nuclease subunit A